MKKKSNDSDFYKIEHNDGKIIILPLQFLIYKNADEFRTIFKLLDSYKEKSHIIIDYSLQTDFDTYLMVFQSLVADYCTKNKLQFIEINISENIQSVQNLLKAPPAVTAEPKEKHSALYKYFERIGNSISQIFQEIFNFTSFFGELTARFLILIFRPGRLRWEDMPLHFTQSGVMALPITIMIVFLLGLITGYQGALQLKQFGADMFIADLVGISLTRELSPLMVAILVAGRSGSAFAAEIGTMKVSEEVDSLVTMGFDKFEFLVLPRILSVTLAMPFLVIICNVVGILGGMIAAVTTLDITMTGYMLKMQSALSLWDIGTGLIKSLAFGFLIASLGCYKGLNVKGGADAVGKYTTSSVVAGVFLIILTDAIFTLVFQALGI